MEFDMPRTVLEDWPWVQPEYSFSIDRPVSEIQMIKIDPTERIADVDLENNSFDVPSMLNE